MRDNRTLYIMAGVFSVLLVISLIQGRVNRQVAEEDPVLATLSAPLPTNAAGATPDPVSRALDLLPEVFTNFSESDIQTIRLSDPTGERTLDLQRASDGTWTAPNTPGELDQDAAQLIARTIAVIPFTETVPAGPETDLTAYGFVVSNPNAVAVSFTLANDEPHRIVVGGRPPGRDGFYAIIDDRPGFYILEPRPVEFLRFQLEEPPVRLTID